MRSPSGGAASSASCVERRRGPASRARAQRYARCQPLRRGLLGSDVPAYASSVRRASQGRRAIEAQDLAAGLTNTAASSATSCFPLTGCSAALCLAPAGLRPLGVAFCVAGVSFARRCPPIFSRRFFSKQRSRGNRRSRTPAAGVRTITAADSHTAIAGTSQPKLAFKFGAPERSRDIQGTDIQE